MATNIHEAKTHLSRLIERVLQGEEIVISRGGKPVAKLVPYNKNRSPRRPGGSWRGKIKIKKNFDKLPEEWISAFYGDDE